MIYPKVQWWIWLSIQPEEFQIDYEPLSMIADKFQWVCSVSLPNAYGKEVRRI
jgi:hypothetical protein